MTISRAFRIAHHRVRSLFRQKTVDAEVARELALHFDLLVAEQEANGMSPADARATARRALGNVAVIEETCRDHRRVAWLHDLQKDVHYGWRMLARERGFTLMAAASLALGLGATSATLSVLRTLAFDVLPFPAAERLVVLRTFPLANPGQQNGVPIADYLTWKDRSRTFDALGVALGFPGDLGADERGAPAERIDGCLFDADMLEVLGARPLIGRLFTADDPRFGGPGSVMVISYALWTERYNRDPSIVGRRVRLNRTDVTIVGVMPSTFYFPDNRVDYWGPLRPMLGAPVGERLHNVVGRLRPGVSVDQVAAELQSLTQGSWGVRARGLRDTMFGWATAPLLTIGAAALLVLLMACANVAALLLARGTVRGPELSLRMALGAARGRIVRQLVTESVLLSAVGGLLGLAVAWAMVGALRLLAPLPGLPSLPPIRLNFGLGATIGLLAIVTGLASGIVPALRASGVRLIRGVGGGPKVTGSAGPARLRAALVAAQVALAFVLLTGATLLSTSFAKLAGRDLNYDPDHLVTFEFRIPPTEFVRPAPSFRNVPQFAIAPFAPSTLARVFERVRVLPGVASVAGISFHPTNSFALARPPMTVERRAADVDGTPPAYFLVTPGFFATMGTPLVRGREFAPGDTVSSPWLAVINETLARRLWPGEDAVGRRIHLDLSPEERPREIVGVVRDIPTRRAQLVAEPVVYASIHQQPSTSAAPFVGMFGRMTFVVRTSGDATALVPAIRQAVAEIEPDRPLASVSSTPVERYMWSRYSYVFVVAAFALVATLIASCGVYGVMSYAVAQRSREIAVRLALGANARDVLSTIGRQAFVVVGLGLLTGIAAALAGTRLIAAQLWGVTPTDPATFGGIALLQSLVAAAACRAPIRRALRTDPVSALKCDGTS